MTTRWKTGAACAAALLTLSCFSERVHAPRTVNGAELCGAAPGANVVQVRGYAFQPAELQVSPGTSVTWVNCDEDLHTSTAAAGSWQSPLLSPHDTYTRRFDAAGSYAYRCDPHPFMTASVVVR